MSCLNVCVYSIINCHPFGVSLYDIPPCTGVKNYRLTTVEISEWERRRGTRGVTRSATFSDPKGRNHGHPLILVCSRTDVVS